VSDAPGRRRRALWAELATLGITFPAYVVAGWLLGSWLDGRFGWERWGAVTGALLGFAGALVGLFRITSKLDEDERTPPPK